MTDKDAFEKVMLAKPPRIKFNMFDIDDENLKYVQIISKEGYHQYQGSFKGVS